MSGKYEAKRAVFLAAGLGKRLRPITTSIPKPLINVNGTRIIDTTIDACLGIGIEEIYIVTGHLADQFNVLLEKYPKIQFIHNPEYNKTNNISSAIAAMHLFENAYIFEADTLINNPKILRKYHDHSSILGVWKEKTNDWCVIPDQKGFVANQKIGGENCYQTAGTYFWSETDAKKLQSDLRETFENTPGGRDIFWELVPHQIHQEKYKIKIIPCDQKDTTEIDTFEDLRRIDPRYL